MTQPLLAVEGLAVALRTDHGLARILDDVALTIPPGGSLGVVGESGCGKSTLLRAILGILPKGATTPSGRIRFQGRDLLAGADGKVEARVELPFQRADVTAEPQAERITIQPAQNLWRIARHTYGQGIRYLEIFAANREQIRDPNLIYPGQVFTLPSVTPASASTSR